MSFGKADRNVHHLTGRDNAFAADYVKPIKSYTTFEVTGKKTKSRAKSSYGGNNSTRTSSKSSTNTRTTSHSGGGLNRKELRLINDSKDTDLINYRGSAGLASPTRKLTTYRLLCADPVINNKMADNQLNKKSNYTNSNVSKLSNKNLSNTKFNLQKLNSNNISTKSQLEAEAVNNYYRSASISHILSEKLGSDYANNINIKGPAGLISGFNIKRSSSNKHGNNNNIDSNSSLYNTLQNNFLIEERTQPSSLNARLGTATGVHGPARDSNPHSLDMLCPKITAPNSFDKDAALHERNYARMAGEEARKANQLGSLDYLFRRSGPEKDNDKGLGRELKDNMMGMPIFD